MTYATADDREFALNLPDYIHVLKADEDRFVTRDRGLRVLTELEQAVSRFGRN
jgi:hypothetical protein